MAATTGAVAMSDRRPLPGVQVLPPMPEAPRDAAAGAPRSARSRSPRAAGTPANRGRFASINAFVDGIAAHLTRSQALAWLVLWRDTDGRTGLARTATADVARRIGASRRAAGEAIRGLIAGGLLIQVRQGGLNIGPSVYRVTTTSRSRSPAGGSRGKPTSH